MSASRSILFDDDDYPVTPAPAPLPEVVVDGTDMLGYIKEIFRPNDTVLFQMLHPTKPPIESADSLDVALEPNTVTSIARLQAEGYNAFVCMNPVDPVAKNRQKQNITAIRTVYIDVDENGKAVFDAINTSVEASEIPAPHFFIGSSEGKFYAVWRVEGFDVDLQEGLNRALAQKFGADKQSTDAARVLRLPGTKNLKYEKPPTCAIFKQNPGPRFKPTDFKIDFSAQHTAERVTVEDEVLQSKMDDVRGFLDWAGILYNEKRAADGGILAIFQCPFEHKSGHHDGEAFAGVGTLDKTGNFRFECKHDSCKGIGWKEFRKRVEEMEGRPYVFGADLLIKNQTVDASPANNQSIDTGVKQPTSALIEISTADWRQKFNRVGDLQTGGVPMLIKGLLPQGISMIGALPGEGKTLFALSLSKALSTGKPFLGRFPVPKPVPVLYLTPESSGAAFRRRCEKFGIPSSDMFLVRTISQGPTLLLDDPAIKAAVTNMKPVVILDTAIRFNKSTDENSATANKIFADEVNALISCGALAVTGLHHANKSSRKDGLTQESALRGTGDLAAICDAVYGLKRNEALYDSGRGPLELEVSCLKSRDFDPPTPFTIAATAKVADKIVSNIDSTGDFVALDIGDLLNSIDTRFVEIVTLDPFISYGDLGMKLSISKSQAQNLVKKLKYRKTPVGWKQSSLTTSVSEDPKASQDVQEEKE